MATNSSPARIARESIDTPASRARGSSPAPGRVPKAPATCAIVPHKLLKGLVLVQYRTARSVFNVLRAPPLVRPAFGRPVLPGARAPSLLPRNKRARCQTRFSAPQNPVREARAAPLRDRQT